MKFRTVESVYHTWHIFGENKETGTVDVSDGEGDVYTNVPRGLANRLITARKLFVEEMFKVYVEAELQGFSLYDSLTEHGHPSSTATHNPDYK